MTAPYIAQWGIIGCGWISSEFVKDLCRPPQARGETEVSHAVAALGAREKSKAEEFRNSFCPDGGVAQKDGLSKIPTAVYGSYDEVCRDENVNIVYVGTVHTGHYDSVKLALDHGKHVLVEKPATLNAAEWASLCQLAETKQLFLMEGMWTRFLPCTKAVVQAVHHDHAIGDVRSVWAQFCMDDYGKKPETFRSIAPELAGGGLLDIGPYPMANTILYHHPKNGAKPPAKLRSIMQLGHTGVDIHTSWAMSFPDLKAMAHCITDLVSSSPKLGNVRICGTDGEVEVYGVHAARPEKFTLKRFNNAKEGLNGGTTDQEHPHNFEGFGLMFEADEVAKCIRDGKLESPGFTQAETQMIMEMFDEMRLEGGYTYLPGLEKVTA